jgi:hypothetical protein
MSDGYYTYGVAATRCHVEVGGITSLAVEVEAFRRTRPCFESRCHR